MKSVGRTSSGKAIPSSKEDYLSAGLHVEGPISAGGADDFNILERPSSKWDSWTVKDHEDASKAHEVAAKKLKSTHTRTNWMDDDPVEMQASHHEGFALMHEWTAKDMKADEGKNASWRDERWAATSDVEEILNKLDRASEAVYDVHQDDKTVYPELGKIQRSLQLPKAEAFSETKLREMTDALKKLHAHSKDALEKLPAWVATQKKKLPAASVNKMKKSIQTAIQLSGDASLVKQIEEHLRSAKDAQDAKEAKLKEYVADFAAPPGFKEIKAEYKDQKALKSDDGSIELQFAFYLSYKDEIEASVDGSYAHQGKRYSYGRHGIDSGMYGTAKEYPNVKDLIKEAIKSIGERLERLKKMNVELTVAGKTWKMDDEGLENKKQLLKTRGSFDLAPSGMDTGYTISVKPSGSRYGAGTVEKTTCDLLGFPKLYYTTFDHD